jgi:hypothetical protein
MIFKIKLTLNKIFLLTLLLLVSSCNEGNLGFYQPLTIDLKVPDGPPAYRAGWYSGCRSGLANGYFANASVYKKKGGPDFGNSKYHSEPMFQKGWGQGWFACVIHSGTFTSFNSFKNSLLSR